MLFTSISFSNIFIKIILILSLYNQSYKHNSKAKHFILLNKLKSNTMQNKSDIDMLVYLISPLKIKGDFKKKYTQTSWFTFSKHPDSLF